LGSETIESLVDKKINDLETEGEVEIAGIKKEISANELEGFTFTVEGLGVFKYIYLDLGNKHYLEIVDATVDPSSEGYVKTVGEMLETIEVINIATPSPTATSLP